MTIAILLKLPDRLHHWLDFYIIRYTRDIVFPIDTAH